MAKLPKMMAQFENNTEAIKAIEMAIGRIFLLGSRPSEEGDIKQYEDARHIAFEAADYLGIDTKNEHINSYQKDYFKIHKD